MTGFDPRAVPDSRILAKALLWLVLSASILLALFFALQLHNSVSDDSVPIYWKGAELQLLKGKGTRVPEGMVIHARSESSDAVVVAPISRIPVGSHPFFRYDFTGLWAGSSQTLITKMSSGETYRIPLPWSGDGPAFVDLRNTLDADDIIAQFAISISGVLRDPVTLSQAGFEPLTAATLLSTVWSQWTAFEGWKGHSINFVIGGVDNAIVSPVAACAAWVGMALLLQILWSVIRRFSRRLDHWHSGAASLFSNGFGIWDWRQAVLIILIGWVVLNARWQLDLWRQLQDTLHRYAGKTWEEKHSTSNDGFLFQFAEEVKARLPAAPQRIVLVVGEGTKVEEYWLRRIGYHLLPHNVSKEFISIPRGSLLRRGDYLLVLGDDPAESLDAARGLVQLGNSGGVVGELVYEEALGHLYRIESSR